MSSVRWSNQSLADIDDLLTFYEAIDPDLANRVEQRIVAAPDILLQHSQAGAAIGESDVRKWTVRGLPFLILYRLVGGGVEVDRVLHAKQNWRRPH